MCTKKKEHDATPAEIKSRRQKEVTLMSKNKLTTMLDVRRSKIGTSSVSSCRVLPPPRKQGVQQTLTWLNTFTYFNTKTTDLQVLAFHINTWHLIPLNHNNNLYSRHFQLPVINPSHAETDLETSCKIFGPLLAFVWPFFLPVEDFFGGVYRCCFSDILLKKL